MLVGSRRARPRGSSPDSPPVLPPDSPPVRSSPCALSLPPKVLPIGPLPDGIFLQSSVSAALSLRSEVLRCEYDLAHGTLLFSHYNALLSAVHGRLCTLTSQHGDFRSRYLDMVGELTAAQIARSKSAARSGRRAFTSSDGDGEDELVARELDRESDEDAEMTG